MGFFLANELVREEADNYTYHSRPMDIRQLQYLVALAREKHFTRAAQACHVTQPTLSGRIRQLEQELGVPIVERGQRFHGLTPDGERVLKWAHTILDNWASLQQEIETLRNTVGRAGGPPVGGGDPVGAADGGTDHQGHSGSRTRTSS